MLFVCVHVCVKGEIQTEFIQKKNIRPQQTLT